MDPSDITHFKEGRFLMNEKNLKIDDKKKNYPLLAHYTPHPESFILLIEGLIGSKNLFCKI